MALLQWVALNQMFLVNSSSGSVWEKLKAKVLAISSPGAFRCVWIQCQGGNISAMTWEKIIFFLHFGAHRSSNIWDKSTTFNTDVNLHWCEHPSFISSFPNCESVTVDTRPETASHLWRIHQNDSNFKTPEQDKTVHDANSKPSLFISWCLGRRRLHQQN